MKFAIYFCGQIASGKTTLAKRIASNLNIPYYGIDDFRVEDKSDSVAWSEATQRVKNLDKYIFESTGLSKRLDAFIRNDIENGREIFVIKLVCCQNTTLERAKKRQPPLVKWEYSFTLEESIKWVDKKLKNFDADIEINTDDISEEEAFNKILYRLKEKWRI